MNKIEPDSTATRDLLDQIEAANTEAFDRLFERHRSVLREFVDLRLDARLRARVDPSDVVQETQMDAFRRLDDFLKRRPMPFHVWLRKTAYDRLAKVRRHHIAARRAVGREAALPDRSSLILARQLVAAGPSPSQRLAQRELVRRVQEAMDQLSPLDREILLMRNIEELAYEEVACLLDLEPATARKRYGRALLRVRKLLADQGLLESQP